jgi:hypothetical protein
MFDMNDRRFVAVYYDLAHEYPGVYRDDQLLATWLRLLMIAHAIWPAPALLPRSVSDAAVDALALHGLIEVVGDEFKVLGLDKQRRVRSEQARKAAEARWGRNAERNAASTADADASGMPHTTSHNTTPHTNGESSSSPTVEDSSFAVGKSDLVMDGLPHLTPEAVKVLENWTQRPWSQAGQKQLGEFDRLVGDYGLAAVVTAFGKVPQNGTPLTARQLIWPAMRILEPFPVLDSKAAAQEERQAESQKSSRRAVEQTQLMIHGYGQHLDATEHPGCPACRGEVAL